MRGCVLASSPLNKPFLSHLSSTFASPADPADIVSRAEQSTFNISGHTVGDPFSFPCQVETCRDDYHVRFTMNSMVVHSVQPNTTSNTTFNYEFPVRDNSAGTYSCFVDLPSLMFMSARETLTLTGEVTIIDKE